MHERFAAAERHAMTELLTIERLPIARSLSRATRHWRKQDPREVAEFVRRDVIGTGSVLPFVWLGNGLVAPVVAWEHDSLQRRLRSEQTPVLYREVLDQRLQSGHDDLAPRALRMLAFITVEPMPRAMRTLGLVSGVARSVAAAPRVAGDTAWQTFACDYYGFTVAEVTPSAAREVVPGWTTSRHPTGGVPHQRRLLEEQLYDVAIRTGSVPDDA